MIKYIIFFLMLFMNFFYTYPLDRTTEEVSLPPQLTTTAAGSKIQQDSAAAFKTPGNENTEPKNQESAKKLVELQNIAKEIKASIRQLSEVKYQDNLRSNAFTKNHLNPVESSLPPVDAASESQYQTAMDHERGNLRDLRQYERFVITKKYPYLDFDDGNAKQHSLTPGRDLSNQLGSNGNDFILAGDQGIYEPPMDEVRNIEIINRGLTGFEIPHAMHVPTDLEEKHLFKKAKTSQVIKSSLESQDESIVKRLKKLINEYEERKNRSVLNLTLNSTVKNVEVKKHT